MNADIAASIREDARKRDWRSVHIQGDQNPPLLFGSQRAVGRTAGTGLFFRRGRSE